MGWPHNEIAAAIAWNADHAALAAAICRIASGCDIDTIRTAAPGFALQEGPLGEAVCRGIVAAAQEVGDDAFAHEVMRIIDDTRHTALVDSIDDDSDVGG